MSDAEISTLMTALSRLQEEKTKALADEKESRDERKRQQNAHDRARRDLARSESSKERAHGALVTIQTKLENMEANCNHLADGNRALKEEIDSVDAEIEMEKVKASRAFETHRTELDALVDGLRASIRRRTVESVAAEIQAVRAEMEKIREMERDLNELQEERRRKAEDPDVPEPTFGPEDVCNVDDALEDADTEVRESTVNAQRRLDDVEKNAAVIRTAIEATVKEKKMLKQKLAKEK